MAYIECLAGTSGGGGGGGGTGVSLVVTCDSEFAGKTITCSSGGTSYTQTCSSTSPYQAIFVGVPEGTWTISGVVDGHTYSTSVTLTGFSANLICFVELTNVSYSTAYDRANALVTNGDAVYEVTVFGAYNAGSTNHEIYKSTNTPSKSMGWQNMTLLNSTRPQDIGDDITVLLKSASGNRDYLKFLKDGFYVYTYQSGVNVYTLNDFSGNIYNLKRVSANDELPLFNHYSGGSESCFVSFYSFT